MLYSLSNRGQLLGFHQNESTYVIGFVKKKDAFDVKRRKDNKFDGVYMQYGNRIDATTEVCMKILGLIGSDSEKDKGKCKGTKKTTFPYSVTLDVEAKLYIPKLQKNSNTNLARRPELIVKSINMNEFLMYPFEKQLGVVMPYEMVDETPNYYTYMAQVIDVDLLSDSERLTDKFGNENVDDN